MFTDMVGYSALTQEDEARALRLLDEHFRLLRPVLARHAGREVKTIGDAFLVEFESALRATECAVEMQRALAERNAAVPPHDQIHIRIGLHLGDVVHRAGDVFGDGVNIAARIEPIAESDGICVSEDVARQVMGKLDFQMVKLGRGELKNISLPVAIYRVELPWTRTRSVLRRRIGFQLRSRNSRERFVWSGALVFTVATAAFVIWILRQPKLGFIPLLPPEGSTIFQGSPPAISPEGDAVVFVIDSESGERTLCISRLDEPEPRKLATVGYSEGLPFWEPDGEWIAFFANGKLRKIRKSGGEPEDICVLPAASSSAPGFGGTWSKGGEILFVPSYGSSIFRVSDSGGDPVPLLAPSVTQHQVAYAWPKFLADGKRFLFIVCKSTKEANEIWLGSLEETGQSRRVAKADGLIGYQARLLVFVRKEQIYAQKIDLSTMKAEGKEARVVSRIYYEESLANAPASMSTSGAIAYINAGQPSVQLQWVDRAGRLLEQVGGKYEGISSPSLSPDGTRIALNEFNPKKDAKDVSIFEIARAKLTVISKGSRDCEEPFWIDNDHVLYASDTDGFFDIVRQKDDDAESAEVVCKTPADKYVADVAPLAGFAVIVFERSGEVWKMPLRGGGCGEPVLHDGFNNHDAAVSRDGRWLAFVSNRSASSEEPNDQAYVRHLPDGTIVQISTDGAKTVVWNRDGSEIFYRRTDGMLMSVVVRKNGDTIVPAPAKPLFSLQNMAGDTFDMTAGGKRFLIPTIVSKPTSAVRVLTGWQSKVSL